MNRVVRKKLVTALEENDLTGAMVLLMLAVIVQQQG